MSTLKVDGIRSNSASSDAITLASDGTCTANITNRSNRNLIINGAMQVAQRGTDATGLAANTYATVDRFQASQSGTDEYIEQHQVDVSSGTTPYTLGFRKAFQVKNGNQTSVGVTDTIKIEYKFEAQDLATSGWNYTSTSSYITLSFWVKSSVAQSFKFSFLTWDGSAKMYPMDTGSLSADTWTKVTKTIPGASGISIDNDNGLGAQINFFQYLGTDYTNNSVTENAWGSYGNPQTQVQTSTWYTTDDSTFEITGVSLEVSSTATDFEHRSYGQELALCQRYFFNVTGNNNFRTALSGFANSTTSLRVCVPFPTPMRATPTFSGSATAMVFDSSDDSASFNCSGFSIGGASSNSSPHYTVIEVSTRSMTAGQGGLLEFRADNGKLNFSAEL